MNLLKELFSVNDGLSNKTKLNILKYKRRLEYFFVFIPITLIMIITSIECIKINNYTKLKLIHKLSINFINNVILNLMSIILITIIMSSIIVSIYKPKLNRIFWLAIFTLTAGAMLTNTVDYIIEVLYQINVIYNNNKIFICAIMFSIFTIIFMNKKVRKCILKYIMNLIEIFLISSLAYLEITGVYQPLQFIRELIYMFVDVLRLLSSSSGSIITIFISCVFISLYSKQLRAVIFLLKNKVELFIKIKRLNKNRQNDNFEIVQITHKVKMPLLTLNNLPSMAVIVPAFNEATTILSTVDSLLDIDYGNDKFTIVVVSDGSTDNTIELLRMKYRMHRSSLAHQELGLTSHGSTGVYRSGQYKHLVLIDKPNGGKADALNLGIEHLTRDIKYVSVVDADSIVDKYSFRIFATVAEQNDKIKALTGTILPRKLSKKPGLKSRILTNTQLFDYLNSFHGERGSLSLLNAIIIIPGAFGFFDKETLIELGGYPKDALAEDGILTLNLHREKRIIIKFVPEAISYTQVPISFTDLRKQRMRWFKGLTELLILFNDIWKDNIRLSLVFLDYLLVEWITPIMTPIGIFIIIANPEMVTYPIFKLFMLLAIITPIIQGLLCMLIEFSYRKVDWGKLMYLPLSIILSPLLTLWRNDALLDLGNRGWGFIKRH